MDYSFLYEQKEKSVVRVINVNDDNHNETTCGTGSIVSDGKTILTCLHCCASFANNLIFVENGYGGKTQARVIAYFDEYDIAILELPRAIGEPLAIKSSDNLKIGEEIFTIGFPLRRGKGMATGHVSSFESVSGGWIRLDASINCGNSGGPLLNKDGFIVGVVNAKLGSISESMKSVQGLNANFGFIVDNVDMIGTVKDMVRCMNDYLNVGIGYAIPSSLILNLAKEYIHV